jgi:hypothetical protein
MGIGPYSISKEALDKIHAQRKKNRDEGIIFTYPKHVFTEERYIPECVAPAFYKLPDNCVKHVPDLTIERIHDEGISEISNHIWHHSISFMARDLHLLRKSYWDKEPFKDFGPIVRHTLKKEHVAPFEYTFHLTGYQGVVFRFDNFLFDKRVIKSNYGFLVPRIPFGSFKSVHSSKFLPSTRYLWYINEFNASFFSRNSKLNVPCYDYMYGKRLQYRSRYQYNFKRRYFRWWRLERWLRSSYYNREIPLDKFIFKPFHFLYFLQAKCCRYFLLSCYFGEDLNLVQRMSDIIIDCYIFLLGQLWIYFIKLIILILNKLSLLVEKSSILWWLTYDFLIHGYIGYILHRSYFFNMLTILLNTNFLMVFMSIILSICVHPIVDSLLFIVLANAWILFPHLSAMAYQCWMFYVSLMHVLLLELVGMCIHTWNYFDAFFDIKFIAQETLPYFTKTIIIDLKKFYDLHNEGLLEVLFPKANPDKLIRVKQLGTLLYNLIYFLGERITPYKTELIPLIRAREMAIFRSIDLETVEYLLILNYLQLEKYYEYQRKKEFEIFSEVEELDKWYKEQQLEKTKERIFDTLRDIERLKTVQLEKIEELLNAGEFLYGMGVDPAYEVSFADTDDIFSIIDNNEIKDLNHDSDDYDSDDYDSDDYDSDDYDSDHYEGISLTDRFSTDDISEETIASNLIASIIPDGTILSNKFSSIIPDGTILSNKFSSIIPDGTILSNIFTHIDKEYLLTIFSFYV